MGIIRPIYSALILLCLYYDAKVLGSESYFAQDFVRGLFSVAIEKPILHHHENLKDEIKEGTTNKLSLLVWNIHKGDLIKASKRPLPFSMKTYDLIALQENAWPWSLEALNYRGDHYFLPTFQMEGQKTGLSIISQIEPILMKGYHTQYAEPFIITPKSYMHGSFKKFDLINVHSLNFVSFEEWKYELERVSKDIKEKKPIIVAGDFNTWDEERTEFLKKLMREKNIKEVIFKKDERSRFLGRPVDYVFVRGFKLRDAQVLVLPQYSDHHALELVLEFLD